MWAPFGGHLVDGRLEVSAEEGQLLSVLLIQQGALVLVVEQLPHQHYLTLLHNEPDNNQSMHQYYLTLLHNEPDNNHDFPPYGL